MRPGAPIPGDPLVPYTMYQATELVAEVEGEEFRGVEVRTRHYRFSYP